MVVLTKADILIRKPKVARVELPDEGGVVFVRSWTSTEFNEVRSADPDDKNLGLQLAMALCNEAGDREFDPHNAEDTKSLGNAFTLGETQTIISESLKLTFPAKKDDIKKNLEPTTNTALASA